MARPSRTTLRRALRVAFGVVVVAFVAIALRDRWAEVGAAITDVRLGTLAVGLVGAFAAVFATLMSQRALLASMGSPLPFAALARVFAVGQLAKYVPGSVWSVVGQVEIGRDYGVPRARMATATLLALAVGVVTAFATAGATLPFVLVGEARRWLWVLWLLPVAVLALHPRVIAAVLNTALRLVKRPPLAEVPSLQGMVIAAAWSFIIWLCYGIHAWLLALDLGASGGVAVAAGGTGAFALAWALGFLFVVAPAGAGVREGVLAVSLATVLPVAGATALALLSRLIVTLGDVLWAAAALGITAVARRRRPAPSADGSAPDPDQTATPEQAPTPDEGSRRPR